MEDTPQENLEVKWHKGDIIRNKSTAHPFLVLHIYKNICTLLVDLEAKEELASSFVLLPKAYNKYAVDSEMKCEEYKEEIKNWRFDESQSYPQLQL